MKKKWILAVFAAALMLQTQALANESEISPDGGDMQVEVMDGEEVEVEIADGSDQTTDAENYTPGPAMVKEASVDAQNFQETVLYENDACILKLTGLEPDQEWGYAWDISFENKTADEVMFFFDNVSVNDYMINVMKDADANVPGGGAVEDKLIFTEDSLKENQISAFADAELMLYVTSCEDYRTLAQDTILVSFEGAEEVQTDNGESQPADGEIVLAQTEDFLIKIKETVSDENGYFWKIYLENNADRTMQVFLENLTIDGLVCDPYWSGSVSAGKKLNDTVSWYSYMLEDNGILDMTEIEGNLNVSMYSEDYEDYSEEKFPIQIYPQGEDAVKPYERAAVEGEYTVLDDEYCKIIVTGREADEYGYYMNAYLENKSDTDLEIVMDSSVLNGTALEDAWGVMIVDIPAGKRCNTQAYWGNEDLEQIGISDADTIESIDVTLHLYDFESNTEIQSKQISLVEAE